MLKKAGIVVAAAAAGLLAVSPMALAGDYKGGHDHHSSDHDGDHDDHGDDDDNGDDDDDNDTASCYQDNSAKDNREGESAGSGLVNISDIAVQVPVQACNNSVIEGVLGIAAKHLSNSDSH